MRAANAGAQSLGLLCQLQQTERLSAEAVQTVVDRVVLRVVASRPLTAAGIGRLQRVFAEMLCFHHAIAVDQVAEIPRQANSKSEDFVSELG